MALEVTQQASYQNRRRLTALAALKDLEGVMLGVNPKTAGSTGKLKVGDWSTTDQNGSSTKKPIAVLHIGPPKTGSSSLQWSIRDADAVNAITNDGYSMPWHVKKIRDGMRHDASEYQFLSCFLPEERRNKMEIGRGMPMCPEGELSMMEQLGKEGKNVFLSAEDFSSKSLDVPSMAAFLDNYWDTTIIYLHRWFHDWVFSLYGQHAKGFEKKSFEDFMAARGSGNVYYFSLLKYFQPIYERDFSFSDYKSIYKYRQHFHNVVALDFNDHNASLHEKVFCDGVPNAKNTCEYFSHHEVEMINQAHPLVYNNIAYGANMVALATYCSRDHFDEVIEKIKHHQEVTLGRTHSDFPMKCLDNAILERLIEVSLEHRRNILTDIPLTKDAEEEVRKEYWMKIKEKSCEEDMDRILEMPEWLEFFDGLENDTSCNKSI